jgi:hypothetical protein
VRRGCRAAESARARLKRVLRIQPRTSYLCTLGLGARRGVRSCTGWFCRREAWPWEWLPTRLNLCRPREYQATCLGETAARCFRIRCSIRGVILPRLTHLWWWFTRQMSHRHFFLLLVIGLAAGTSSSSSWDVCVVGAGPAGVAAAAELRSRDYSVLVLDKQAGVGGQSSRCSGASCSQRLPQRPLIGSEPLKQLRLRLLPARRPLSASAPLQPLWLRRPPE